MGGKKTVDENAGQYSALPLEYVVQPIHAEIQIHIYGSNM